MAPTGPCQVCGADGRNGKAPYKYCDQHIEEGILAKHIKSKRARPVSPATSTATQSSLPDGWKLLSIETVVDCRHGPSAEPARVPAPHRHATDPEKTLAACADRLLALSIRAQKLHA